MRLNFSPSVCIICSTGFFTTSSGRSLHSVCTAVYAGLSDWTELQETYSSTPGLVAKLSGSLLTLQTAASVDSNYPNTDYDIAGDLIIIAL